MRVLGTFPYDKGVLKQMQDPKSPIVEMSEAAVRRKIKQNVHAASHVAVIVPAPGFKEVCHKEMQQILGELVLPDKFGPRASCSDHFNEIVISQVSFRSLIQIPLQSLTAENVWWQLASFKAESVRVLEKSLGKIEWPLYLARGSRLALKIESIASRVYHEGMIKEKWGQLLAEQGYELGSFEEADHHLWLRVYKDKVQLFISLATEPLFQRGYRRSFLAAAPLREHLAAAIIRQTLDWAEEVSGAAYEPDEVMIPYAGSGTFLFETLAAYYDLAGGLWRSAFAMEKMPCFVGAHFSYCKRKLLEKSQLLLQSKRPLPLWVSDRNEKQVEEILLNWQGFLSAFEGVDTRALQESCLIYQEDFLHPASFDFEKIRGHRVFILFNPPYGVRLSSKLSAVVHYKKIGEHLSLLASRYDLEILGAILAGNEEAWQSCKGGLKGFRQKSRHFTQGGRDIRLLSFWRRRPED
jgi:23S rRNA G2445 N2-methylase RlmL